MKHSKLSSLLVCGAMIASLVGGPMITQAAENADITPKTEAAEKPAAKPADAKPEEDKPVVEIESVSHTLRWAVQLEDKDYALERWYHVESNVTPERLTELYGYYQEQIDAYLEKHNLIVIETKQDTNEKVSSGFKTIEEDNVIIVKEAPAENVDEHEGKPENEAAGDESSNGGGLHIDDLDDLANEHGQGSGEAKPEGEGEAKPEGEDGKKEEAKPEENKVVNTSTPAKGSSGQQYAQTGTLGGGLIAALGASLSGAGAFTMFRRKK